MLSKTLLQRVSISRVEVLAGIVQSFPAAQEEELHLKREL